MKKGKFGCEDVTWKNVDFKDCPLTKREIEKADRAFWIAYNHITNLWFNKIEKAKPIREAMEKAREEWMMNIIPATKDAIASWNKPTEHKCKFSNGCSCDICGRLL